MSSSSKKFHSGDLASKYHGMLTEDEFEWKSAGEAHLASETAKSGKGRVEMDEFGRDPRYVYIQAEGAYDKSPYLRL